MQHTHGPNCGCAQYADVQNSNDLIGAIDIDKVRCLNQESPNTGKSVFKDFEDRFDKTKFVASDCDGELLLIVPFTSQVKIRAVTLIARSEDTAPCLLKLYTNIQNVDFSVSQQPALQQFIIPPNLSGDISNAVKITKFGNVHKLILHLSNPHRDRIEAAYVQIKGENTNIKRQAVKAVYEVMPNAKKNQLRDMEKSNYQM